MLVSAASVLTTHAAPGLGTAVTSQQLTKFSKNIAVAIKYPNIGGQLWNCEKIAPSLYMTEIMRNLHVVSSKRVCIAPEILSWVLAWHQAVCTSYIWHSWPADCIVSVQEPVLREEHGPQVWQGVTGSRSRPRELDELYAQMSDISALRISHLDFYNSPGRDCIAAEFQLYSRAVIASARSIGVASEINRLAGQ